MRSNCRNFSEQARPEKESCFQSLIRFFRPTECKYMSLSSRTAHAISSRFTKFFHRESSSVHPVMRCFLRESSSVRLVTRCFLRLSSLIHQPITGDMYLCVNENNNTRRNYRYIHIEKSKINPSREKRFFFIPYFHRKLPIKQESPRSKSHTIYDVCSNQHNTSEHHGKQQQSREGEPSHRGRCLYDRLPLL